MKKSLCILISLILFLFPLHSQRNLNSHASSSKPHWKLIQTGDYRIEVKFDPGELRLDERLINKKEYASIDFQATNNNIEGHGFPQIPYKSIIIGTAPNARPVINKIKVQKRNLNLKKIVPNPDILYEEPISRPIYIENDSIYSRDAYFPDYSVQIVDAGFFRDQKIWEVRIFPLRYNPVRGNALVYSQFSISIDLVYERDRGEFNPVKPGKEEIELYRKKIENFSYSRKWLARPGRKIPKIMGKKLEGDWYKMTFLEEGVYRIDLSTLSANGINLEGFPMGGLKIFAPYTGGQPLSRDPGISVKPNIIEVPAMRVDVNGDGSFNGSDYILFFGIKVNRWFFNEAAQKFEFNLNPYTFENVYWLNADKSPSEPGIEMEVVESISTAPDIIQQNYREMIHHEREYYNFLRSGLRWYGESFQGKSSSRIINFDIENLVSQDSVNFAIRFKGGSMETTNTHHHSFAVYLNGQRILSDINSSNYGAKKGSITLPGSALREGKNELKASYSSNTIASKAHLDWFNITFSRSLKAVENILEFFSSGVPGAVEYHLGGFSTDEIFIFDVSSFKNVRRIIPHKIENGSATFRKEEVSGQRSQYLALIPSAFSTPLRIEKNPDFANVRLRNPSNRADFIIIAYDDFYDEALKLKELREKRDGLKTKVVKISDVYNEFSAGIKDPLAIRFFLKYAYNNWQPPSPSYLLLLGDGDYDFRNISGSSLNLLPTFQIENESYIDNREVDDGFVYLTGPASQSEIYYPDMAVGRLTARDRAEAKAMVDKIINYETQQIYGNWKNTVTLVADDFFRPYPNEIYHIGDTESILVPSIPKSFVVKKLYLPEYPMVQDVSLFGVRRPGATEAILNQLHRGTLIINFIG
ncbi:MAG: C25 family cysteine peptidase, partial [Fidelibacterota bacterium]